MAKRKQRVEEERELTRKEIRLRTRDRERNRRLYVGAGIAIGLALILVVIGAVLQFAIRPNRAIASVGDQQIITRDFWQRMRFERWQLQNQLFQMQQLEGQFGQSIFGAQIGQIQSTLANPFGLGVQVLDQMIDDEVIKQEAATRGITVSEQEIDEVLRQEVANSRGALTEPQATETAVAGVDATATAAGWTPTPAPTVDVSGTVTTTVPTPEALATRPLISETGYSEGIELLSQNLSTGARSSLEEYREIIRIRLLSEKLIEAVTADTVPATEEQVHARHILIGVSEPPTITDTSSLPITATMPLTDLTSLLTGDTLTGTEAVTETTELTESEPDVDDSTPLSETVDAEASAAVTTTETVSDSTLLTTTDSIIATDEISETTPITTSELVSGTLANDPTAPRSDAAAFALAQEIRQRLLDGEDFATLAALYSSDTTNNLTGGDLGWFGQGAMVPEFDTAAFSLPVNEISEPIKTQYGYHILEVLERDDARPKDENQLQQEQFEAFQTWLQEQKNAIAIERPADLASLLPPDLD